MRRRWIGLQATSLTIVLLLVCLAPASAVDGVIEINQARALAGGVAPGDSAGYPVSIDKAGSYRLTGPLVVSSPTTDAIQIEVADVTLDLNGFTIEGPAVGTGNGVSVVGINARVRNGTIASFGNDGITADVDVHVDRVVVLDNDGTGIRVEGAGAIVTRCIAYGNNGDGIRTGPSAAISDCTAVLNGQDGIQPGPGSTVIGNAAGRNTNTGINSLHGCTVTGNSARWNGLYGLSLTPDTGFRDNVSTNNTTGNLLEGKQIGGNVCGAGLCP